MDKKKKIISLNGKIGENSEELMSFDEKIRQKQRK